MENELKITIDLNKQQSDLLDAIVELGCFGSTREEIIRRFMDNNLQHMIVNMGGLVQAGTQAALARKEKERRLTLVQ